MHTLYELVGLESKQKLSRRDAKAQGPAKKSSLRSLCVSAPLRALFSLLLVYAATAFGQSTIKIHGRVMNADSVKTEPLPEEGERRAREYAQKSLALAERHKPAELREEVGALLQEIKPQ